MIIELTIMWKKFSCNAKRSWQDKSNQEKWKPVSQVVPRIVNKEINVSQAHIG